MFKKLLAAVGVGGAEVETELRTPGVQPGGSVEGVVRLRGGEVAQQLDGVSVEFVTRVEHEVNDDEVKSKRAFGRQRVGEAVALQPGQVVELPFQVVAPLETPITFYGGRHLPGGEVAVRTRLEISGAVDATDTDPIGIGALPAQHVLLHAVEHLGFRLHRVDCEAGHLRGTRQTLPFYQEVEFHGSPHYPRLKQLEVTFIAGPDGLDVVLEGDKKAGLITSGRDLSHRLSVDHQTVSQVDWAAELHNHLSRMSSGWF
ncbi:SpoOM family protein [Saccharopolyspora rhizosphaerae]|uniref:SpoOM family protein n=1 Tax=Saccharopolyspora rhizosphaerae TaxID=2492662 RepID=A0A426JPG7_9PSEU|nr:sporulation protein [Saccharopolyspora rhizosphaerae]RRO15132.1 SpoOM family protein [Saccharopolyspora rhizosphaerae]